MSSNNSVIDALASAVEAKPKDIDLRIHLASMLLHAERPDEALHHYACVLAMDPVSLSALKGARRAAEEAGESERASAYAKLLKSLGVADTEHDRQDKTPGHTVDRLRAGGQPSLRIVGGKGSQEDYDTEPDSEDARITLADVAGLEAVKRRLELAFLGPLRNPAMSQAYGKKLRGGLLLYGAPGCGKTYIARALAGELRASFISIGLNDVLNMWLGESEQRLHAIFDRARQSAPTVIFIDELDALGRKRSDLVHSGVREVVNQLLQELDGVGSNDEAVFVLGATNLPWDVDVALKRPGRFDRAIFVEPPDLPARERIFELNLKDRPIEDLDFKSFAKKTKGYSGADIAFLCELATEKTLERAMQSGQLEPITANELKQALKETRPSISAWFETARNYAMFANASGEFNDLASYIDANRI